MTGDINHKNIAIKERKLYSYDAERENYKNGPNKCVKKL